MNDKLNNKNYMKWDRTFMAFGSIMNAWQGNLTKVGIKDKDDDGKEIIKVTTAAWGLAKKLVSDFVDELYEKSETTTEEKAL